MVAVVAMLLGSACGGKDKSDVKSAASDDTTSTTMAADTSTTAAAGATTTVASGGKSTTTAKPSGTPPTASGSVTGKAPVPAAPGTYDYTQSGTSTVGTVPTAGTLRVDAAGANGSQVLHRYIDPSGQPTDTTLAFRTDGPFITQIVQRQQQVVITCNFNPPIPAPPWPATDGKPIAGKADCGAVKVEINGSITGHRTTKLDGKDIDVVVATVTVTTHGQVESTGTQTQWWAPSLRLTVHEESHTKGNFGAFPFESSVTADLKSAKPR